MSNHLSGESSPYLLQHAENPVDWYPWGQEAFDKASVEDKPVFLSIGYSTCHWCHVMARESFEDSEIASILNRYFVAIKVDKEERPDVDSIYMAVCQALTGSGGWPTSVFMTPERKPFFAGTYFPKTSVYGSPGLKELLLTVHEKWTDDRASLLRMSESIVNALYSRKDADSDIDVSLTEKAIRQYKQSYDAKNGGFGNAPKFPAPHNLLFLMKQYRKSGDVILLEMAEKTLLQMYRGGICDHIGGGFCRYSTDKYFLVPHFEKMLYDNALLIIAYCEAYQCTRNEVFKEIAVKTATYVLRDMKSPEGCFKSAQDADSDGEEGKYYVFSPREIENVIGENDAKAFCGYYDITERGNFNRKSIPNLLRTAEISNRFDKFLPAVRKYREGRTVLHTDDKILTLWNSLMIAALCFLYRITGDNGYIQAAKTAQLFIEQRLCDGNTLYVSRRNEKRGVNGFIDDYAGYIYALIALYESTLDSGYLNRARQMANKANADFFDTEHGGYFLYGNGSESLIARTKECYDGAIPSGNSLMAYNLVRLNFVEPNDDTQNILQKQLCFMSGEASRYPSGYAMFLTALSDYLNPGMIVTVVRKSDDLSDLPLRITPDVIVRVLDTPREGYELLNGETAFYVCKNHSCRPPVGRAEFYRMLD